MSLKKPETTTSEAIVGSRLFAVTMLVFWVLLLLISWPVAQTVYEAFSALLGALNEGSV